MTDYGNDPEWIAWQKRHIDPNTGSIDGDLVARVIAAVRLCEIELTYQRGMDERQGRRD